MTMFPGRRQSGDREQDESVGWISMTDLMVVIVIVAVSTAGAVGFGWSRYRKSMSEDLANWKSRAEEQSKGAQEASDRASALVAELAARKAELAEIKLRLGREISDLRAQLAAKTGPDSVESTLRAQLDATRSRASAAESANAAAQRDLALARGELAKAQVLVEGAKSATKREAPQLAVLEQRVAEVVAEKVRVELELAAALKELEDHKRRGRDLTARIAKADTGDRQMRQEILGISGSLERVVFLVDQSGSMRGDSERWNSALKVVHTWIDHLPVREAALIWFSSDVVRFPAVGMVRLTDEEGKGALLRELNSPRDGGGSTSFKQAIDAAFSYEGATAIVLFTDGKPDSGADASISGEPAEVEIPRYVQSKRDGMRTRLKDAQIPRLHVVAVGDYFRRNAAQFLIELSKQGGGTFIGR
jgi:hypothetical protein